MAGSRLRPDVLKRHHIADAHQLLFIDVGKGLANGRRDRLRASGRRSHQHENVAGSVLR